MTSGLLRRTEPRRPAGDEGTTLMELMVGMVIMTILMAICTGAVVSMFVGTGKTQAVANSAQQLNTAFVRLDDQVRYATAIDQPTGSMSAGTLSVAFLTVASASTGTTRTCSQLWTQTTGTSQLKLMERSWQIDPTGAAITGTTSPWSQLAGGIVADDQSGVTPFAVSTPTGATVQQLNAKLVAMDGTGQTSTRSFSQISFSAQNSAASAQAVKNGSYLPACLRSVST